MDNFMDKLAKRFNAGEIIKANAQAEARDLKRAQERAAEYERLMQEMRRLNLKNVEVTEQVQQLIQCGIEQFESYGNDDEALGIKLEQIEQTEETLSNKLDRAEESFYRIDGKLEEVQQALSLEILHNQQEISAALKELEERAGADSGMEEEFQKLEESLRSTREILIALRMGQEEGQKHLEDHVHKENVRVYRNVQAAVTEEATKKTRELNERIDKLEKDIKKNSGIKPLLIFTFLLALASVAIQILQMLQLL